MNDPESIAPFPLGAEPPPPLPAPRDLPAALPIETVPAPPVARTTVDRRDQVEREFREVQRVGIFYGAMLLPVLAITGWVHHTQTDELVPELWGSAVLYAVIGGFAFAWRHDWLSLLRRPAEWSNGLLALTIATPLGTLAAVQLLAAVAETLGLPVDHATHDFLAEGYPVWLVFILIALLPALFEEVAFRGVLLAKLQHVMRPTQAVWVSAVLFGIIHFSVLSMAVFLVPLAAIAAYLTRRTGSLLPAIAMHAIHNAGVVVVDVLQWP